MSKMFSERLRHAPLPQEKLTPKLEAMLKAIKSTDANAGLIIHVDDEGKPIGTAEVLVTAKSAYDRDSVAKLINAIDKFPVMDGNKLSKYAFDVGEMVSIRNGGKTSALHVSGNALAELKQVFAYLPDRVYQAPAHEEKSDMIGLMKEKIPKNSGYTAAITRDLRNKPQTR